VPPKLVETLGRLGSVPSAAIYHEVLRLLGGSLSIVPFIRSNADDRLDAADAVEAELASWVLSHQTSPDAEILAVWMADRVGAKLKVTDFATHVGDLWYPSMDDVLLVADDHDYLKVLILDHEEIFTYSRMEKEALRA
jgi:hypothetical protein